MLMARNLIAGLISSLVLTLTGLVVVPAYLHFLGIEGYGLISFYLTLQFLLQVFDLGLTANREVARAKAVDQLNRVIPLVLAISRISWSIAIGISIVMLLLAPWLATDWLQLQQIHELEVVTALSVMAFLLGVRWLIGMYQGILIGTERIVYGSAINMMMHLVSHGGAVAVLAWGQPSVLMFFAWQAFAGVFYLLWMRSAAWHSLGRRGGLKPDFKSFRQVLPFSLALLAVNAVGLVLTQVDKLFLSKLLPLQLFGYYALASLVASGLYAAATPVFNTVYPRFTALAAARAQQDLENLYRLVSHLLACLLCPLALLLVFSGRGLIQLWTGDAMLAASVAPIIALLSVGTALHSLMYAPHALTLSLGAARLAVFINLSLLLAAGPLIYFSSINYGALGAATAWLGLQIANLIFGSVLTHRTLMPKLI